jgi:hypothetical protein
MKVLLTAIVMMSLSYVFDNIASFLISGGFLFHVIAVPAIEESARYYAASRFCWVAPPGKAALIGLLIGLLEIGTKTFEAALFGPRPSASLRFNLDPDSSGALSRFLRHLVGPLAQACASPCSNQRWRIHNRRPHDGPSDGARVRCDGW